VLSVAEATEVVRQHLGPSLVATSVTRASAGNGQETWLVDAGDEAGGGARRSLVLRRTAEAGTLEWTERAAEHRVLRALEGRGLPVPAVHGHGVLERPYLLMERLPGSAPGRLTGGERVGLARELGRWLARLHALDPVELGLEPVAARTATLAEVAAWRSRYLAGRPGPVPLLGALLAWLERNAPEDAARPALLWGDPGPHNVLVADGRVSALLDWELAHVGHPLEDLGAAVWSCLGRLDDREVVAAYEAEAGVVDRGPLDYFVALACASRSVMLLQGLSAWLAGRTSAPSAAGLGLGLLTLNLARGARAAGWGELPPPDGRPPELPLRPDVAEAATGVARWLLAEVEPAVEGDRRLRRMTRAAATLLETAAQRVPPPAGARDPAAAEEEAVRAEEAGGNEALRAALLADLARELPRLAPLTAFHGHA